jgi:hypothetical protein
MSIPNDRGSYQPTLFSSPVCKYGFKRKYDELRQRMGTRKAAVATARKFVVLIYSMLKNGTLFTVEEELERQWVAAYHARKHLPVIGRDNQIRQSCKEYSQIVKTTNSMAVNELGVLKFIQ